jgi:2-deoxy-D-gluconate 3-dehydrogenase
MPVHSAILNETIARVTDILGRELDTIAVERAVIGLDTELTRDARREMEGLYDRVLRRTPAGRWDEPEDPAGIAVFLAGPASDFVTGAAIPVDGGFSVEF